MAAAFSASVPLVRLFDANFGMPARTIDTEKRPPAWQPDPES